MLFLEVILVLCVLVSSVCSLKLRHRVKRGLETEDSSNPIEEWFEQRLDHFNAQVDTTWKQLFYRNDAHYKPGGPAFLLIGPEGNIQPSDARTGSWIEFAKTYNATCFVLEHRYYGKSRPTPDLTTENLAYLSSEQALADTASFIAAMNRQLGPGTRWVAFGGSYAGSLAAWARLKYPHLVYAAVSSSAPMVAIAQYSEYYRVIAEILKASDPTCVESFAVVHQKLEEMLGNRAGVKKVFDLFKLCKPTDNSQELDEEDFYATLADQIAGVVQYGEEHNLTLSDVCTILGDSESKAVEQRAHLSNLFLRAKNESCLDFENEKDMNFTKSTSWDADPERTERWERQWVYQMCTEFGFFQTSTHIESQRIFGHFSINSTDECAEVFGPRVSLDDMQREINWTNTNYGGINYTQNRTIFIHGSYDPWYTSGITTEIGPDTPVIFIEGGSHCSDMFTPSDDDPSQFMEVHNRISSLLGRWLNL